jgi:hypothetical protein
MAICATTSVAAPQAFRPGSSTSADFNLFTRFARVLCSAGARPQKRRQTDNARLMAHACPFETGS